MHVSLSHVAVASAALLGAAVAQREKFYHHCDTIDEKNWHERFEFYSGRNLNDGVARYVTANENAQLDLAKTERKGFSISFDHNRVVSQGGQGMRNSVRLHTHNRYKNGVFIVEVNSMVEECGTWPSIWFEGLGPYEWPAHGSIGMVQGVHGVGSNAMTIHTAKGCNMQNVKTVATEDCNKGEGKLGCGQQAKETESFGTEFNKVREAQSRSRADGAIYMLERTDTEVKVWMWHADEVPDVVLRAHHGESYDIDTSSLRNPSAHFRDAGDCNFERYLSKHRLVAEVNLCGGWAGNTWSQQPKCNLKAASCNDFMRNPETQFGDNGSPPTRLHINKVTILTEPDANCPSNAASSSSFRRRNTGTHSPPRKEFSQWDGGYPENTGRGGSPENPGTFNERNHEYGRFDDLPFF